MNTNSNSVKRVLIDTTFLFDQYALRGIGRTGKEIVVRLIPLFLESNYEVHLAGFDTLQNNLIKLGFSQFAIEELLPRVAFTSFGEAVPSGVRNVTRWQKTFKPLIEELKPDLFFASHFERGLPTVNLFKRSLSYLPKTAVICYDVIPLKTNKFTNKDSFRNFIKKRLYKLMWTGIKNADLILTISHFSKKEIASIPGIDETKIKVVHLGISKDFYKSHIQMEYDEELVNQVLEFYGLKGETYFYYDSGIESNKGIFELLTTFSNLSKRWNSKIPQNLVITGGDFTRGKGTSIKAKNKAAQNILEKAKELGVLENIFTTDRISDRDLVILLANAKYYINLSRYEGFGLGIAQAFAAEVPVIASNLSSYPEIAQDAALLVSLDDLDKLEETIRRYTANEDLVKANIEKGKNLVLEYDWDKTAQGYFNELKKLLEE